MSSHVLSRHPRTVLFQEIDAAGIAFYARVFDWFHDAYVAHFFARGIDLAAVLTAGEWGAPLVHAEADYQRPFRFGDRIAVEILRGNVGEKSLTVEYRVVQESDPTATCATGKTVHVFVDRREMKPRPVPDQVRAAFESRA